MPSQDPHSGGDLSDMAKDGTTMPNDAGAYPIDHSTPKDLPTPSAGPGLPHSVADTSATGEVETGTGDVLPDVVEQKRIKVPDGPQLDNSVRKQKGDSGPQEAVPAK